MTADRIPLANPGDMGGFTLIEVITAMAVLGIVMTTLFRLQSATVTLFEAALFRETAPVLARQQLAALELNGFKPDELPERINGAGYTWACQITEGDFCADWDGVLSKRMARGLRKIKVTVFSPDGNRGFTLVSWRFSHEE